MLSFEKILHRRELARIRYHKNLKENRARERERQRKWRAAHPELVAKYRDRKNEETKQWQLNNRDKHLEANNRYSKNWKARNPDKTRVHQYTLKHLRKGDIQKSDKCSGCGKVGKTEAHHPDYSRRLDIVWLCVRCHRRGHMGIQDNYTAERQ